MWSGTVSEAAGRGNRCADPPRSRQVGLLSESWPTEERPIRVSGQSASVLKANGEPQHTQAEGKEQGKKRTDDDDTVSEFLIDAHRERLATLRCRSRRGHHMFSSFHWSFVVYTCEWRKGMIFSGIFLQWSPNEELRLHTRTWSWKSMFMNLMRNYQIKTSPLIPMVPLDHKMR